MRLIVGVILMGLIFVYGLVSEYRQDQDFINKLKQEAVSFRLDEDTHRSVASWFGSSDKKNFFIIIPYDDHNKKIINGTWLINTFVDSNGLEHPFNIRTKLELLESGQVLLAGDERMVFKVSEIGQSKKNIQLIRFFGDKSETVIATRVFERKISQVVKKRQSSLKKVKSKKTKQEQKVKGVTLADSELKLVKAIVPTFSKVPLFSVSVTGNVSLRDGTLENFYVSLKNAKEEEIELEFSYADIMNGGQFSFEGEESSIQGIFTNDGKSAYRMRFATGPLSGSILNFVKEGAEAKELFESVKERPKPVSAREINRKQNDLLKQRSSSVEKISGFEFSQVSS